MAYLFGPARVVDGLRYLPLVVLLMAAPSTLSAAPADAGSRLTPKALEAALAARPAGAEADRLAEQVRQSFGADNLRRGPRPIVDELTVAWALEAPEAASPPRVVSADGKVALPLVRVGQTDVYAAVATLPDGAGVRWHYEVGEKRIGAPPARGGGGGEFQLEVYRTHPDAVRKPGVLAGEVTQQPAWQSKIFDGTTRDWWIYTPAQYRPESPACVMVFQDGAGFKNFVPPIFDNLIAAGEMPVTVGIFISPGTSANRRSNRSFEYDTLSDQYTRFLLEEILPEVEKRVNLRHDAAGRAICGSSSGGICAFTVAWERPEAFSKVLSWVGSFTNIASGPTRREGGHNYPALIRKTPRKPIRVFLQDGENDLDNVHGNWPLSNQQMAKALAFAGYDYRFEFGHGFHSGSHGRAILPDSLRWLWRKDTP